MGKEQSAVKAPVVAPAKSGNKGKRESEEAPDKAVSAKKQKINDSVEQALQKAMAETKLIKKQKVESSSSDDSSSEENKEVPAKKPAAPAVAKKEESSGSLDSDSSEDKEPIKTPAKAKPAKKEESSDTDDEEEKPAKAATETKKPVVAAKMEESSDDSSDESSDSDDEVPAKKPAPAVAKKEESNGSSEDKAKDSSSSDGSDDDSSEEDESAEARRKQMLDLQHNVLQAAEADSAAAKAASHYSDVLCDNAMKLERLVGIASTYSRAYEDALKIFPADSQNVLEHRIRAQAAWKDVTDLYDNSIDAVVAGAASACENLSKTCQAIVEAQEKVNSMLVKTV